MQPPADVDMTADEEHHEVSMLPAEWIQEKLMADHHIPGNHSATEHCFAIAMGMAWQLVSDGMVQLCASMANMSWQQFCRGDPDTIATVKEQLPQVGCMPGSTCPCG